MNSLHKLVHGTPLDREDFKALLTGDTAKLFAHAQAVRQKHYGHLVYVRGLIEISSYCMRDCYYCGLRKSNNHAVRYRLTRNEIMHQAALGYAMGLRTFVLQGGEDPHFSDEVLIPIVRSLRERFPEVAITLSLGERSATSFEKLKRAGADRYLLRHETANAEHYHRLHPKSMTLQSRQDCLYELKRLGFQTGAGMMVGSPGQTLDTLMDDLMFLQELKPQMVGIGPFLQSKNTPFSGEQDGSVDMTLRLLAIVRCLLPLALIPATTALATKDESARIQALQIACNVVMPNLSPDEVRADYAIYNDKKSLNLESVEGLEHLKTILEQNGLELSLDRGDYKEVMYV